VSPSRRFNDGSGNIPALIISPTENTKKLTEFPCHTIGILHASSLRRGSRKARKKGLSVEARRPFSEQDEWKLKRANNT
jgi:hypothetical protein